MILLTALTFVLKAGLFYGSHFLPSSVSLATLCKNEDQSGLEFRLQFNAKLDIKL